MVAPREVLKRVAAQATRAHFLWLVAWLLVAGALLVGTWWLDQGSTAQLAAASGPGGQPAWDLKQWAWCVCGAGLAGAAVVGILHALAALARERSGKGTGPGRRKPMSGIIRAELQRIATTQALMGFALAAFHWIRLTALLIVATGALTMILGLRHRRGEVAR